MNGKAAPILLVAAALAIAAAVLLTTRAPVPPAPGGQHAEPTGVDSALGPAAIPPAPTTPTSAEPAPPKPAMVGQNGSHAPAPALAVSGTGEQAAAAPASAPRTSGRLEETVDAAQPGNIQAEMAVAQALAAAGLSTADIKIATLGSAPAATADEPASEAEATPAPSEATEPVRSTRELVVPVPTGAKVPVVFYDNEPRPQPQQQALDRIATEFSDTVNNPPAGYSQQEVWEAARKIADERYTVLYGFDAFNQMSMQAAKEALKEKKAASAQPAIP